RIHRAVELLGDGAEVDAVGCSHEDLVAPGTRASRRGERGLEGKTCLRVCEVTIRRDLESAVDVIDAGVGRRQAAVHGVEAAPVADAAGGGRRYEHETNAGRFRAAGSRLRVDAVLRDDGRSGEWPASAVEHARADAVATERPHHNVGFTGGQVSAERREEVTRG